jgi:hypothetical protein
VKTQASAAVPATDDQLVAMLRTIGEHDGSTEPLDNRSLGRCLGWTAVQTADSLAAAKARLLIWGIRVGGSPAPSFEEIELTVQGRRLLTETDMGTFAP